MPSISSLQDSIRDQRANAESHRKRAESLLSSASDHESRGDTVQAQRDRESAERYLRDAEESDKTATSYEQEVERRRLKAKDIESKLSDLDQRYKRDRENLEREFQLTVG